MAVEILKGRESIDVVSMQIDALAKRVMEAQDLRRQLARASEEERPVLEARLRELLEMKAPELESNTTPEIPAEKPADGFGKTRTAPTFGVSTSASEALPTETAPRAEAAREPEKPPEEVWQGAQALVHEIASRVPAQEVAAPEAAAEPETVDLTPNALGTFVSQAPDFRDLSPEDRQTLITEFLARIQEGVVNDSLVPEEVPAAPEVTAAPLEASASTPEQAEVAEQQSAVGADAETPQEVKKSGSGWDYFVQPDRVADKNVANNNSALEKRAAA